MQPDRGRARDRLAGALQRAVDVGFGPQLDVLVEEVRAQMRHLSTQIGAISQREADGNEARNRALRAEVAELRAELAEVRQVVRATHDELAWHRRQLWQVRATPRYAAVWDEDEPLVSVRIATYNRGAELREKALQSVLDQTYERYECIVVGDGCTDDTAAIMAGLGDPRFSFVNLPHQSVYPEDDEFRWYVAGAPAMNTGARLARGTWIAPLDDDDCWTPRHIEVLLSTARAGRFELAYGRLEQEWVDLPKRRVTGAYPPVEGEFSFQGSLYLKLLDFFEYDTASWVMREPGDWNLCRRMRDAGVRIGFTDDVVGTMYFKMKAHHLDRYRPALEQEFGAAAVDAARAQANGREHVEAEDGDGARDGLPEPGIEPAETGL